jgi:hypothetical protein
MTNSDDLAYVIDDVARRITAVAPVPDVRRRVLDRLHDRQPRRWRLALVPAAAAIVISVSLIARNPKAPASLSIASNGSVVGPAAASHVASDATPVPTPQQAFSASAPPRVASVMASIETRDAVIPPLPELEPISVGNIQPNALEIRPLLTTPLVVPPLPQGGDEADTN